MSTRSLMALLLFAATGCGGQAGTIDGTADTTSALTPQEAHGRDVWFNATFGGEKFFTLLAPQVMGFHLGFDQVLTTPRAVRFNQWGVVNDPGCTQGDATTGYLDRCTDPNSSGVVGIRKFPNPTFNPSQPPSADNSPFMFGVSCAGCHAGLDAQNPPADPNNPSWSNIHATTGNQYLNIGKIFAAHLPEADPRWQVFHTWKPGTVDTTAIENDHINNPGIVTQFFNTPERPYFNLTDNGTPITVHRGGQGGEDDAGCEKAALRVYFNIGMCAAECMLPHLTNGPGGTQTPIDDAECAAACPDYVQAKAAVGDMCAFMATTAPPELREAPNGNNYITTDGRVLARGQKVFQSACASCHGGDVLSDDLIHPQKAIGTNSCRSRTTNWKAGQIWAEFSSDQYKARPDAGDFPDAGSNGPGYYRDVPLIGIWATAPFFHNNRVGTYNGDPSVAGRVAAYQDAMNQLLNPTRGILNPIVDTTTTAIQVPTPFGPLTLPQGTPVAAFANLDPTNPLNNLCPDLVENEGHYFGVLLSQSDKYALTEYLKTK